MHTMVWNQEAHRHRRTQLLICWSVCYEPLLPHITRIGFESTYVSQGALFGVFVLAGFLLPSEFTAGTELDIDAPPPDVFEVFNSQAGIQQW